MSSAQALQAILGSTAVLLGLLVQSLLSRRFARSNHDETNRKLDTVEATVNGTTHALTARVEQLAMALQAAGIPVPPSPAKGET